MSTETKALDITRTQLVQAPPARVMQAFFADTDLKSWWGVTRAFIVARPLGLYAIGWETTEFKDDVLGRLGGSLHGTIIDYRARGAFFLAEAYWQPPDGEPIGPMALEVHCRPHGSNRQTMVTVRQSAAGEGPRWQRYFEVMDRGWETALVELANFMDRETARTRTTGESAS
jgi:uncharacterized protein YndB with AHSA1/START domain